MTTPSIPPPFPLYLGPELPRWQPSTPADVAAAIDNGSLAERHWLDAKAAIGPGDEARKEIARDLASFANDGGALLIGVKEDRNANQLSVREVPLAGLAEQVEQIARTRCEPPLFVVCRPLKGDEDTAGVLLVEVPPSASAPHMVDGSYHGRGDKTKYRMSDSDVARLHAVRSQRQATAEQLVAREIERDPVPSSHRELSHLYVVAQPFSSPPDLFTPLFDRPTELQTALSSVWSSIPSPGNQVTPNFHYFGYSEWRAQGLAFHSPSLVGRRMQVEISDAHEAMCLDVEFADDGRIVLFCGGASSGTTGTFADSIRALLSLSLTRAVLSLAGQMGQRSGYGGRWMLAVGLTDLFGKTVFGVERPFDMPEVPFSDQHYTQGTEAVTSELLAAPGPVTRRLLGRLIRGLGVEHLPIHDHLLA